MTQPYDLFADWFEYLNDDCDYSGWSQYFIAGLRRMKAGNKGLELGCGSGAFCRRLARAGFSMSGADLSPRMLAKAEQLAREEGLHLCFFLTDAASMRAPEKYDFILSPNDCFNYLPPARLPSAFKAVARCLGKEGIFWFDLSSEYKLREKIGNTVSADDRDEVTYLAFNAWKEDRLETDVTLFVRRDDGAFDRSDMKHIRYAHREEDVFDALVRAGFRILAVEGDRGESKEKSDRLNFICRKP